MRSNVSTSSGALDSESPVAWSFRLRGIQDRIAASRERIEPVRLGLGPLEPLLLLGRELIVVACSILDGGDELPQAVRALKPARVAKQGAQLATFLVALADLRFVSGARFLVGPPAAPFFFFLRAFRFGVCRFSSSTCTVKPRGSSDLSSASIGRKPRSRVFLVTCRSSTSFGALLTPAG